MMHYSSNSTIVILLLLCFSLLQVTLADNETVIPVDLIIPISTYVALDAPVHMNSEGFVDLSRLEFTRLDNENDKTDGDEKTIVDIAVFAMPDSSGSSSSGSSVVGGNNNNNNSSTTTTRVDDYQSLGITKDGYTCCSSKAQKAGVCTAEQEGRLIVDEELFDGVWLSATIHHSSFVSSSNSNNASSSSTTTTTINPYEFDPMLNVEKRGYYTLFFANCGGDGDGDDEKKAATRVQISGNTTWVSFFTDQEIENSVPIYILLTSAYFVLFLWFGYLMYDNQSSRVPLEVYILVAIGLGFVETGLETIYYANESQHIVWLAIWTEFFGATKNGVSRCLLLMLSLGWGVTVATLERRVMIPIIVLTVAFTVLSWTDDIISIVASAKVEEADESDEEEGTVGTVRWILSYIDLIIWYWIPSAMCNTMKYLEENQQLCKLQRYRWLLGIMIAALVLNILAFFFITMELASNIMVNITIWPEVNEAGFFLTLVCVAILWRPNPQAREYAYQVELLSPNDEVFDLELTDVSSTALPIAEISDDDIDTACNDDEDDIANRDFT
eukprot:CAMPEP_0119007910 /NCGR_PEP_ID=MMETSP1176-20130426/3329_1 /TAXON_ID=265551 /ORGANISM="Synedropsis recta cf, Strain CCMP1620" /LENGTH=555 /DNA_ID=CAMNT_0006960143 /DNA_START=42 /DNA_END=1709 /DNA_ORIENTATION=-